MDFDYSSEQVPVLDHGFVRLDNHMADDLSVVNAARVSFAKRKLEIDDSDEGLIAYLMRERHGTPFEHNAFRFHVKAPIFVAREWMRHRIGSFNEWSARYSKLEPEFYLPSNVRQRVGKPGHYRYEPVDEGKRIVFQNHLRMACEGAFQQYELALAMEIAPEQARFFLPVNVYTQFYWTINARSLMNFLSLRNASTAQWEIRQYAEKIEWFLSLKMPLTHRAFVANERTAP